MTMMGDSVKNFMIFASGAAIGSVITWNFVKAKYEQIANEEITSVKDTYAKKLEEIRDHEIEDELGEDDEDDFYKEDTDEEEFSEGDMENYYDAVREYEHNNHDNSAQNELEVDKPYVISPEEFGEFDNYEQISLTYYDDGYLADDMDDLVEDVEDIIGWELLNHIGEYEEDAIHIRNDSLKTDYEILRVMDRYSDISRDNQEEE